MRACAVPLPTMSSSIGSPRRDVPIRRTRQMSGCVRARSPRSDCSWSTVGNSVTGGTASIADRSCADTETFVMVKVLLSVDLDVGELDLVEADLDVRDILRMDADVLGVKQRRDREVGEDLLLRLLVRLDCLVRSGRGVSIRDELLDVVVDVSTASLVTVAAFGEHCGEQVLHGRVQRPPATAERSRRLVLVECGEELGEAGLAGEFDLLDAEVLSDLVRDRLESLVGSDASGEPEDRRSTRLNSSPVAMSSSVFC